MQMAVVNHTQTQDHPRPEPQITTKEHFTVAGLRYAGNNAHGEIPALWQQFIPRAAEVARQKDQRFATYGVTRKFRGAKPDEIEYLAGVEVHSAFRLPHDIIAWDIPTQTYAVLPAADPTDLGPAIDYFYRTWLPRQLAFEPVDGPSLEYYPTEYPDDPRIYLYFPVAPVPRRR